MDKKNITADMMLPDIITQYPAMRKVLDRYGLKGCGGPTGPLESVAWFARAHAVPLESLLEELNAVVQELQPETPDFRPSLGDTIYRFFFGAGVVTVLSLGCLWGAVNLFLISHEQNFGGIDYSWALAHGHAMVFGFVGFFIMGFAYQAFPRFKHASLWKPGLAFSTLSLMAAGILLQALAHVIAPRAPFLLLGIAAGLLQVAAVLIFFVVIVRTFRLAAKPEKYDRFIYAALGWFTLAAILNPVIFWLFESASTRESFLFRVSTFNIPYRDIQLFGVATVMILGVSLRFLPHAYGMREPTDRWRGFLFWGVNGAILAGILTFLSGRLFGNHWWLAVTEVSVLILLFAALGTPRQYRLFGPVPENERDRGLKFVRAAYVWFIVAVGLLAFAPIYMFGIYMPSVQGASPFSHAYFGAYRHSLTVGFIMMMIVGVSSKVIPTLSGVDVRQASGLWATFILLNIGNVIRISTEIATDFTPAAYNVMGVSGFIEVIALVLWGYEMVSNMRTGKRIERESGQVQIGRTEPFLLTPQCKIADLLKHYPRSLDVLLRHGFAPLANPVLRRTMARVVTIEQACRREGVDLDMLLSDLRRSIDNSEHSDQKRLPSGEPG
jgi:hypothetical protein